MRGLLVDIEALPTIRLCGRVVSAQGLRFETTAPLLAVSGPFQTEANLQIGEAIDMATGTERPTQPLVDEPECSDA